MTALAWVGAIGSFLAFLVALQIGPSCATATGIVVAVPFLVSWGWLAYTYERREIQNRRQR